MQQPGILGQLPWLSSYTQLLIGFPLSVDVKRDEAIKVLQEATKELSSTFPFLAGQVVHEIPKGRELTNSGTFSVTPYTPHADGKSLLHVKDCTDLCPSYEELARAKAPMTMLDGKVLAPMKGLPEKYMGSSEVTPVLIIQANFIKGGLLLCFSSNHHSLDMNGQGQMIRLFATACRGEQFNDAHVKSGNLNINTIISLLNPETEPLLAHRDMRCPSSLGLSGTPPAPAQFPTSWRYYRFSASVLAKLKAEATQDLIGPGKEVEWISTNDALTAFIWHCLSAARAPRLKPDTKSIFQRAVNGRRCLDPPVPEGYMGHLVAGSGATLPVSDLVDMKNLAATTLLIRKSLKGTDDYHVRSLITTIDREEDKTTFAYEGGLNDPGTDLVVSSWADLRLYEVRFGELLGFPGFVRRPTNTPCECLTYLMPRTREGDIDALLCLRDEDHDALEKNDAWASVAEVIG